jgi:hypothetical protein
MTRAKLRVFWDNREVVVGFVGVAMVLEHSLHLVCTTLCFVFEQIKIFIRSRWFNVEIDTHGFGSGSGYRIN